MTWPIAESKNDLVSPEAHEAYLQGRYFWNRRTAQALIASLDLYEKAARLAPNSAEAYAAMAVAYTTMVATDQLPPQEMEGKGKAAAEKALSLDENRAEPHVALAALKALSDYTATAVRLYLLRYKRGSTWASVSASGP